MRDLSSGGHASLCRKAGKCTAFQGDGGTREPSESSNKERHY
jgi:hypothetical protein